MSTIAIMMIAIFIVTIAILVGTILYFYKNKKRTIKKEVDYRAFYLLGIIWIPIGVVFMISVNIAIGISFLGLGIAYMAIGLANKDKWYKQQ